MYHNVSVECTLPICNVVIEGLVQKGHISVFGPIFTFCIELTFELTFGKLTCFDMKSIVP